LVILFASKANPPARLRFISHLIAKPVRNPVGKALANLGCNPFPNKATDGRPLVRRQCIHCTGSVSKAFTNSLAQLVCESVFDDSADGSPLLGRKRGWSRCFCVSQPIRESVGKALADLSRDAISNHTAQGGSLVGRKRVQGGSGIAKLIRNPIAQLVRESVLDDGADGGLLFGRERGWSRCSYVSQPIRKSIGKALADLGRDALSNHTAQGGPLVGWQRVQGGGGIAKPIRDPIAQLVCESVFDDSADGGLLFGREHRGSTSLGAGLRRCGRDSERESSGRE
jgi:hypothetical protein